MYVKCTHANACEKKTSIVNNTSLCSPPSPVILSTSALYANEKINEKVNKQLHMMKLSALRKCGKSCWMSLFVKVHQSAFIPRTSPWKFKVCEKEETTSCKDEKNLIIAYMYTAIYFQAFCMELENCIVWKFTKPEEKHERVREKLKCAQDRWESESSVWSVRKCCVFPRHFPQCLSCKEKNWREKLWVFSSIFSQRENFHFSSFNCRFSSGYNQSLREHCRHQHPSTRRVWIFFIIQVISQSLNDSRTFNCWQCVRCKLQSMIKWKNRTIDENFESFNDLSSKWKKLFIQRLQKEYRKSEKSFLRRQPSECYTKTKKIESS